MIDTAPTPLPAPPRHDRRVKPHRLLRFDVICRATILLWSTVTVMLAWFVPRSLTAQLIVEGGAVGYVILVALTAATTVGIVDLFINDALPARFCLRITRANHHRGYSLISTLFLFQAHASIGGTLDVNDLLPLGYIFIALASGWYSWATAVRGWHV